MAQIPDVVEIDSLEEFDALISPQRLQLAEILATPMTAKEAARELDVPVTRLYYHLNALLEVGLVTVVEERPKGALKERVFQVAGRMMRPSRAFLERYGAEGLVEISAMTFRHAEARFAAAVQSGLVTVESEDAKTVSLGLSNLNLSEERLAELVARLEDLQQEFSADTGDIPVSFFHAAHKRKART